MKHEPIMTSDARVQGKDFAKALKFVAPIMARKSRIPVLETVKVEFGAEALTVTGTDLDMWFSISVPAVGEGGLSFCASPGLLAGIARAADGGAVAFEMADGILTARTDDGFLVKIRSVFSASEFPPAIDARGHDTIVSEDDLAKLLGDTVPFIPTEEARYYLNGVYFHQIDGNLAVAATDGHALSRRKSNVPWPSALSGILPVKAAQEMLKHLRRGGNGGVSVAGAGLVRRFAGDGWQITTKLIDGTFPNYERVIPTKPAVCSFPISLGMINRLSLPTAWPSLCPIIFDLAKGVAEARYIDKWDVSVPLIGGEGDIRVSFDKKYLRRCLRLRSPARVLSSGEYDPAIIETEDPDMTLVVMTMRV